MEKLEILTFSISGRAEASERLPNDVEGELQQAVPKIPMGADSPEDEKRLYRKSRERKLCEILNKNADRIATEIQDDLRRLMPLGSGISSQADMSFQSGSIIIEGSVALLCWAGKTALEPIREEMAGLIKIGVKRVFTRSLSELGVTVSGLELISDKSGSAGLDITKQSPASSEKIPTETSASSSERAWFLAFMGLLSLLVLILLADRLISTPRLDLLRLPVPAMTSQPPATPTIPK